MAETEGPLIEEIRFNPKYASLVQSQYPTDQFKDDSVPTIKRKTLFTEDYLKRLNQSLNMNIMPPNCRYIEETQKGHLIVIEEPPAYRTIKMDISLGHEVDILKTAGKWSMYGYDNWEDENHRPYSFTLAFPYVIFILYISKYNEIHDGQVFARTQQMSGMSDYLLKIPLTNISEGGHVCFGDKTRGRYRSLLAAVQQAIMVFWSAEFNTDYMYNYNDYGKHNIPVLSSLLEWQYMSQVNPMFIYNADWQKLPYTLGERIEYTKSSLSIPSKRAMGYKELSEIFFVTQETGTQVKAYKKSKKTYELYYDIAQGTYLTERVNVSVGDSFKTHKGETAFIDTFAGFADGSDVMYVIIDINGYKHSMKLTDACRKYLSEKILEDKRVNEITLENKETIKTGDILYLSHNGHKVYYKVEYIRRSRGTDGDVFEIKMGNSYFLTNNLNAKVFNIDEPKIDDTAINKEDQYIVIDSSRDLNGIMSGSRMLYDTIDVTTSGNVSVRFKNAHPSLRGSTNRVQLSSSRNYKLLYPFEEVKRLNNVFRYGRKLYYMYSGSRHDNPAPECAWGVDGVLIRERNFSLHQAKNHSILKSLIDGDRFFVEGVDFDIEFNIGDKVVCANWENPLDVLTVKVIQGFKITEGEYSNISFVLADREGKLTEQRYVTGRDGIIHVGTIRKVTNKVGRLSVGTKIKANVAGISCFPKKDVNIIVAFIVDTGNEPLVLCSNGCTLWYNDVVENFTKVTMKSKRWEKMQHVPLDLSKIKFQAGDVINGTRDYKTNHGYLLNGPSPSRALRALPLEYFGGRNESYCVDRYMTRECRLDCIPAPRVAPTKIEEIGVLQGTFNFHSFDVTENLLETRYLNQRRG